MKRTFPQPLGERYQLLEPLGLSDQAEVFRARMVGAEGFAKTVVIKKLLPRLAGDGEAVARFIGEARLAALLHHENIVDVYDCGVGDAGHYVVREYLDGRSLRDLLARVAGSGLHPAAALFIARAVCSAIEYAHNRRDDQGNPLGIAHGALDRDSVFVCRDGRVKISGFAVAGAETGGLAIASSGTPGGEERSPRGDIFAIGVLLYEMLAGRSLDGGISSFAAPGGQAAGFADTVEPVPGLPAQLQAVLGRLLSNFGEDRYRSCSLLGDDLADCLHAIDDRFGAAALSALLARLFPEDQGGGEGRATAAPALGLDDSAQAIPIPKDERQMPRVSSPGRGVRWLFPGLAGALLLTVLAVLLWTAAGMRREAPSADAPTPVAASPQAAREDAGPRATPTPPARPAEEDEEAAVKRLLARAERAVSERGRIGGGEEAVASYRQVLALHPGHAEALAGMAGIAALHADSAEQAIRAGRLAQAAEHLQRGLAVFAENERLNLLKRRLERLRQEAVERLVAQAERALAENRLTSPANDCAYRYYKEIEQLEGPSATVSRGLERIADRYAELAEEAYRELNRAKCREYVRQGLAISPRHGKLLELQRDLQRSLPGMFFKSLEKSFKPLFDP